MKKLFDSKSFKYIAGLLAIPLIWYIAVNLLNGSNGYTFFMIFLVVVIFAILMLIAKKLPLGKLKGFVWDIDKPPTMKYYILTIVFTLLLPLGGLALNLGAANFNDTNSAGLFGDFSHPAYYIIAIVNCLLLLIPPLKDKRLRLLLFYVKAAGYTYILYFFIVFLPILPLGAIGIIFYGLGLFVWAPAIAAIWQGIHMFKEWMVLKKEWGIQRIVAVFAIGIITFPMVMGLVFWGDKANFEVAAQYLNQQNYESMANVNLTRLKRTLKNIKGDLEPSRGLMGSSNGSTPIISEFYSHYILDGKTISQYNVMALENLFFDMGNNLLDTNLSDTGFVNNSVQLTDATSETKFDEENGVYRTWVNLKLKNPTDSDNGEYITTFKLPAGAYISDYYLDVLGTRKTGILADRRAALFIYRKIVNTRKDPGLLHYIGKNTLELRVFPFGAKEERLTGFEIIHSQQFDLELGSMTISLDGDGLQQEVVVNGGVLLSSDQKVDLQPVEREPKYYFIVDNSKNSDVNWHVSQIEAYTKVNNIAEAEVLFASYKVESHSLVDMQQGKYEEDYGYNLNLAMRKILNDENKGNYPIIIAVSDNMPGAIFPQNIYTISREFPESQYYYALNHNLTLTPYSFEDNKAASSVKEPLVERVLDYNGSLVLDNGKSELVLTDGESQEFISTGNQYQDALLLDVLQQRVLIQGNANSVELVRASFRSRILTPQTAFIVVETNEQEKELFDLQEQILNNDLETPFVTLEEPPLLLCILLVLLIILFMKNRLLLKRIIA